MSTFVLILVILGLIISIAVQIIAETSFIAILVSIIPYLIIIFLLWELRSDTKRIKRLEEALLNKEVIKAEDIGEVDITEQVDKDNATLCPHCNYQIFPEDKICPNCKTPIDDLANNTTENI